MTRTQRNEAISRKIAAYTAKFTVSREAARAALVREGFARPTAAKRDKEPTKSA